MKLGSNIKPKEDELTQELKPIDWASTPELVS